MFELEKTASNFELKGSMVNQTDFAAGHVNKTFLLTYSDKDGIYRYIMQRIKSGVFCEPDRLMDNIERVSEFIRLQLEKEKALDISRKVLSLVKTKNGDNFYRDPSGLCWRVLEYIENTCSYNTPKDAHFAFQAGKTAGNFGRLLAMMPLDGVYESIPDFHDGQIRFLELCSSIRKNVSGRLDLAQKEVNFLFQNKSIFSKTEEMIKSRDLQKYVTHNDMKMSNILFDIDNYRGLCMVDFDTVMPGYFAFDFGDLVRTTIAKYDYRRKHTDINMEYFRAVCNGYVSNMHEILDHTQRSFLIEGVVLMPLMLACRYLTDFLNGDLYFNVYGPFDNLNRAKIQIDLFKTICQNIKTIRAIFNESFNQQTQKAKKAAIE